MKDLFAFYVAANRTKLLLTAALLVVIIALTDWLTKPYISIGFLYLFPIMIVGGALSRTQTAMAALLCAVLQEVFSELPTNEAVARLLLSSAGFVGTGLFIGELVRNRRMVLAHLAELEGEVQRRQDAEQQMRSLVESSPAAIVVIDAGGEIVLANQAANELLAPGVDGLVRQNIRSYVPSLETAVQTPASQILRTAMQCRGQRGSGETFLAGIWFSTYVTVSGRRLAAIIVDLSEDLRSREDLSLDHLLMHTRIVMGAVAHEIGNLSSAARTVHKNLSRVRELEQNEDFRVLSTLIQSLENVAELELRSPARQNADAVELTSVLDEVRVLIEATCRESGIDITWRIPDVLPLVWADRYGLVQVFLNLAKNSERAMRSSATKHLTVSACPEHGAVIIRFQDSGPGVVAPDALFRPFQRGAHATGLGLYVSRSVMRSFGGDLIHEPTATGASFAVILPSAGPGGSHE